MIYIMLRRGCDIINKYSFLGFGEVHIDKIYDSDHNLIKEHGGGTTFNILYNLGLLGENAYALGIVGNDENTEKAISFLSQGFVNTDHISIENKITNVYHLFIPKNITDDDSVQFSPICPVTKKETLKRSDKLPSKLPEAFENENIILVISDFGESTFEFIKEVQSKSRNCVIVLDIGSNRRFSQLTRDYIADFLSHINIIQMNKKCVTELYGKLSLSSNIEFFDELNLDLLIVTKGREGANFIYRDDETTQEVYKKPKKVVSMVDPTGAGDAFLSMVLKSYHRYLLHEKKIDNEFIDKAFMMANGLSRKIVGRIGARADLEVIEDLITEIRIEEKDTEQDILEDI